uniref:Protein disulfide-isomerase n=1 Tax=Mola mola TaxID=94237 RepID=A0A3Q3W8H3_MOLML
MRTRTLLSITLLGLLLWASSIQADNEDANADEPTATQEDAPIDEAAGDTEGGQEEEETPKKEKTTDIEEEKDVMVLHINNFARALSENQHLLVEFYAPWCGHCRQLEPLYAEAAGRLKKEGSAMRLAKVDATEEKELAEEFEMGGFPTLKLFISGDRKQPIDFTGKRSSEGIIQWLKRRASPGLPVLDSVDSAVQFIDAHNITVVGFFDVPKVFKDLYLDKADTEFAVSANPEVFQKYEVKENSVVLFKKVGKYYDPNRVEHFPERLYILIPSVCVFQNAEQIFTSSHTLHSLLFFNSSVDTQAALNDLSIFFVSRIQILFISIDVTASVSHVLNYFGVSISEVPTARVINMETGKKFTISSENHKAAFKIDYLFFFLQPYYKSQEIPEDWNKGPVKVLVGKNFESVALDPTKNVFVEFYAPWCGHCKELAPIWEQLGEKYADKDDIIIAKMDATVNEVESINIQGFPTLKYFPADGKEVVDYTGKRDLETLSKFLDDGGVLPEETTAPTEALLQTMYTLSWKQYSLMAVASFSRIMLCATKQKWFRNGLRSTTTTGPPNSPDLNPIEHLGDVLNKQV